jgi:[protein-PII] uridylyltransferase
VQDAAGEPYGAETPGALDRLARALEAAARGEPVAREARRGPDLGRSAAFAITPMVMLDNDASETSTVVEASGRDRPGLLADLARALSDADLSILSAHIDGYGERAVDAFYVVGPDGKVADARKRNSLKTALEHALADEGEVSPRRANLQRARASVAR